jgi:hypothetical protein
MNTNWPSPTDYGDALQHPERALYIHEDLREANVEMNKLRRPKGRSGNFAIVYKVTGTKGPAAIKVFKNPEDDRQRRYQAVSVYLDKHRTGYTVGFEYFEHGIYVNSGWFPALRMDWVEGETLGSWLIERLKKKDTASIKKAADAWVQLMEKLQAAKIAHGDLQHGNILIVKGVLKLVDYDGMCVPALRGSDQAERGLDGYQHRLRKDQKLGLSLDHFSAWIILLSLRAIAADPGLHEKYKKRPQDTEPHENLLFVVDDLHPDNAKKALIWNDLKNSRDPEVREWAANLWECLDKPFDQIPPFAMDPYRPLRAAIAIQPYDWEQIARLSKSLTRIPPDCDAVVTASRKRVDCRDRLLTALDKGDARAIAAAYDPGLLDDWDACKELVRRAKLAGKHQKILAELVEAARNIGDGRAFVNVWKTHAPVLAGVAEAKRYQKLADEWIARIRVGEAFLSVLNRAGATERQIADAWKQVETNAPPHPDIVITQQERGKLASRRIALLGRLGGITNVGEESDKQLKSLWAADLFDGCTDDAVATVRKRLADALQRLDTLNDLSARIAAADKNGDETAIIAAASRLPADYPDAKTKERIALARDRQILEAELRKTIERGSDRAIKTAWDKARKKLSPHQMPHFAERCQLAERRCKLLDQLDAIDQNAPADVQDEHWESTWQTDLLNDCADARSLQPRYDLAVRRRKIWRELDTALQRGLPVDVRTKAGDRILSGYPPMRKKEALIVEFIRKADDVDRILAKLKQSTNGMPLNEADLNVLRTSPELFGAEIRSQIESLVAQRLRSSLKLAPIDDGYELEDDDCIKLQWSWPDFALISSCYVDVQHGRHATLPSSHRMICSVDDHRRAVGGMRIFPTSGGETCVTIWPVVNLGWKELLGQPLFIGPIGGSGNGDYSRGDMK